MTIVRSFTVGDRLVSLLADLYDGQEEPQPIDLDPAETVVFRMILASDGSVKVDDEVAVIVTRGDAVAVTPAQVRYDWRTEDVDTAGSYLGWFIRQSDGQTEHFPTQDRDNAKFRIIFRAET
jgi:hypothetical protein